MYAQLEVALRCIARRVRSTKADVAILLTEERCPLRKNQERRWRKEQYDFLEVATSLNIIYITVFLIKINKMGDKIDIN